MIAVDADGAIRTVTLDRPDRHNALDWEGLSALEAAIAEADEPVIYLHGAGESFCAGADLNVVAELSRREAAAFARRGQRVATAIEEQEAVVVCGIDGPARGGGVELALACDVRVATPTATLGETGIELGLFGAWGGTIRLPEVIGQGDALEFALTGRIVDAAEARQMGLVSRVVDHPRDVAVRIAGHEGAAIRTLKDRIRDDADRETKARREAEAFAILVDAYSAGLEAAEAGADPGMPSD